MAGASSATAVSGPIAAEIAPLNLVGEPVVDRSTSEQHGNSRKHNGVPAPTADSSAVGGSNATVSFNGANMFDQRTLNGFYLEPPDQGLCVSHAAAPGGRALEVVNDVMAVYDFAGTQLKKQTLNQMFGYPPLLSGGPEMTDPSCYYDEDTGAWIAVALTLELGPHGGFTGANHL